MRRVLALLLVTAALAVLSFATSPALACGKAKCCEVGSCQTEKTEDGFRCTMKAKDEADVAALREMIRSSAERHAAEGVYVSFEDVEGGITMTMSATDPEVIEELHAKADACASGRCGGGCGGDCGAGCGHGCDGDCAKKCGGDCGKTHDCGKHGEEAAAAPCGHAAGAE